MKRILNLMVLIAICIFSVLALVGCAPMFDALNFNRKPLPDIESEVEDGLKYPYETHEVLTQAEFENIIESGLSLDAGFEDTYRLTNMRKYGGSDYNREISAVVLDKETVAKSNETNQTNYPYAEYRDYYDNNSKVSFFDGYFKSSGTDDAYAIDEYIDDLGLTAYDVISGSGLLGNFLEAVSGKVASAKYDYANGKKIITATLDTDIVTNLEQLYIKGYRYPNYYGSIVGLSPLEIFLDEGNIIGANLSITFSTGFVKMEVTREEAVEPPTSWGSANQILPSFVLVLNSIIENYSPLNSNYESTSNPYEYKAEISHTQTYYLEDIAEEFSFYNIANKDYREYYSNKFLSCIETSGEKMYFIQKSAERWSGNEQYVYVDKNGKLDVYSNLETDSNGNYTEKFTKYREKIYSMDYFLGNMFYTLGYQRTNITLVEEENAYKITARLIDSFYDDLSQTEVIYSTTDTEIKISKDFSKLYSVKQTTTNNNDEITQSFEIKFTYDFNKEVPSEVTKLPTSLNNEYPKY